MDRHWSILTKEFVSDENGQVKGLRVVELEWVSKSEYIEVPGSEKVLPCDLALLAIGYAHPKREGLLEYLGVDLDLRGNVKVTDWHTNVPGVFAAGDIHRGQSLVVWAISEGREAAKAIEEYVMGESKLEAKDSSEMQMK